MHRSSESGQSTVEAALLLPLLVVMAASVLQVGIFTRDHLALWRVTGSAARLASINPDDVTAIQHFVDEHLHLVPTVVEVARHDNLVTTTLHHRYSIKLVFVNTPIRLFSLSASVTMHVEDTG